jgi:hypothetical protein
MVRNQFNIDIEIPKPQKIKTTKIPKISSREPVRIEIKKKVIDRAKKICEYPRCKEKVFLEFHHKNMKNNDNRASNIELLCSKHHRMRHIEKIRKTVVYDIVTGQKIIRLAKKSKKKTTKRKTFKKSISKRKTFRNKNSKNIWNVTFDNL